jgi:hypothetical protein
LALVNLDYINNLKTNKMKRRKYTKRTEKTTLLVNPVMENPGIKIDPIEKVDLSKIKFRSGRYDTIYAAVQGLLVGESRQVWLSDPDMTPKGVANSVCTYYRKYWNSKRAIRGITGANGIRFVRIA